MEKEKPFLFTDLVPPDQSYDQIQLKNELCEGTIPVRTWATGSPFKILLDRSNSNINSQRNSRSSKDLNDLSHDGMLNYIYQENSEEELEYDEEEVNSNVKVNEEDSKVLEEQYSQDDYEDNDVNNEDDYIPSYSFGKHNLDDEDIPNNDDSDDHEIDIDEEDVGQEQKENEDYEEDDYEDDDYEEEENDIKVVNTSKDSYKKVSLSNDELEFISSHQNDDNVNDLINIMNEYNELVNYITSPRKTNKNTTINHIKETSKQLTNNNNNMKSKVIKQHQPQMIDHHNDDEYSSYITRNEKDIIKLALKEDNNHPINKTKIKKMKNKIEKKKLFGYAKEQYEQQLIQQKININNPNIVDDKHRILLATIVEKRKKEEEDNIKNAEIALLKRKKFKEALLEKALKNKNEKENHIIEKDYHLSDKHISTTINNNDNKEQSSIPTLPNIVKKEKKETNVLNNHSNNTQPRFLSQTKAYQAQIQGIPMNKQNQQMILTDEELLKQEEEKREHIANIRRKFKEQHKEILYSLQMKNKEEEKKLEEEQLKEAIRKEKHRLKLMRLIAEKQEKNNAISDINHIGETAIGTIGSSNNTSNGGLLESINHRGNLLPSLNNNNIKQIKVPKSADNTISNNISSNDIAMTSEESVFTSDKAVGSALAAIRRRSRSMSANMMTSIVTNQEHEKHNSAVKLTIKSIEEGEETSDIVNNEENNHQLKQARIAATKEQQEKLANYLNSLSEQRKKEEIEKKKEEDRRKRRASLLSARLLQEAAERKQLGNEGGLLSDPSIHNQQTHNNNNNNNNNNINDKQHAKPIIHSKDHNKSNNKDENEKKENSETISSIPKIPKKPKMPLESTEKLVNRLHASKFDLSIHDGNTDKENNAMLISSNNIPIRDFADWKRKNSVPADANVFSMTGWYPCVRDALLARGWYQNPDIQSPHANLKWTLRSIDVNQDSLQSWQLTNHFVKNSAITTKAGLIKSLQSLVWLADVDADNIIPRGYDLSNTIEMQAFIDDFRCQRAEGLLKRIYYQITGLELPILLTKQSQHNTTTQESKIDDETISNNNNNKVEDIDEISIGSDDSNFPPTPSIQSGVELSNIKVNIAVFEAICNVLEKQIKPYDDSYIDEKEGCASKVITDLEWELINTYNIDSPFASLPSNIPEPIDLFLREKEDPDMKLNQEQKWAKRRIHKQEQELREQASLQLNMMKSLTIDDFNRIHIILCSLLYHNKCQTGINGKGKKSLNMWIVKPAAKSRGRGISTFMDLSKILKYVDAGTGRFAQWIVQKYIENPLIIAKRKFDLRQWVLVTNWNPLTIYFYDECYARFSVDEYSTEVNDLSNSYIHLVNNSIGKNSEKFHDIIEAENGEKLEGYMWSHQQIGDYVKYKTGKDLMKTKIHPRMKDIAQWSLMCASEMIEHRKNSWELYGFDFMVDDEYNAWLIEINSSPACDYSTSVTERYVQKALVELLSVVLDYREWENQPKKTRGNIPDIGGWERIYQGPLLETPVGAFGTEMSLKGEGYKLPTNYTIRNHNNNTMNPLSNILLRSSLNSNTSDDDNGINDEIVVKKHQIGLISTFKQKNNSSTVVPRDIRILNNKDNIKSSNYSNNKHGNEDNNIICTTNNNNHPLNENEFNDSDEEKQLNTNNNTTSNKNNKHLNHKGLNMKQKVIGIPPVASIPIKVFSVEF